MHGIRNGLVISVLALTASLAACAPTAQVTSYGGPSMTEAQAIPYNGPRARLAVARFDDKTAKGYAIGDGMKEMLTTALFNSNRFIVLERQQLGDVLQEQDLGAAGRIKKETAAPVGEIEGAEILVMGAVTEFEPNAGGVGGGLALPGLPVAGILGGKKSHVAIDVRLVDAKTSRILAATSVEGSATDVGGGFITNLPLVFGGYSKTPMEKALRLCIQRATEFIAAQTPPVYYRY